MNIREEVQEHEELDSDMTSVQAIVTNQQGVSLRG